MPAYVVTCCPCGRFLYFASNLLPEGEFDELDELEKDGELTYDKESLTYSEVRDERA